MQNHPSAKRFNCLKHALLHHSGPTLFLFGLCLLLGSLLLFLGLDAGSQFIMAGLGALLLFLFLGLRPGCHHTPLHKPRTR
jgi:hypothetical protein